MKKILCGRVAALVVTHEDRLLRFGVDLMRYLCRFKKENGIIYVYERKHRYEIDERAGCRCRS